jgi:hypothetical protein
MNDLAHLPTRRSGDVAQRDQSRSTGSLYLPTFRALRAIAWNCVRMTETSIWKQRP